MVLTLLIAACSSVTADPPPGSIERIATELIEFGREQGIAQTPVTVPPSNDELLAAFRTDTIVIDGTELSVAVADTPDLRGQGLMGVDDLGDLDGMLFVFASDIDARFWMKDVPISLDIWFFGSDGSFLGMETMVPCDDPCTERYSPGVPFRFALETEVGRLDRAAVLDVGSIGG
jgi:uncharacterized membrane protein (UPF0127 family)